MPLGDPDAVRVGGLRVAFYTEDGETATSDDTAAAVREAAEALRQAGALVTERCPTNVGRDALELTRRYWGWNELEGGGPFSCLPTGMGSAPTCSRSWKRSRSSSARPRPLPRPSRRRSRDDVQLHTPVLAHRTALPRRAFRPFARGLPIGVQTVGRMWREDQAVAAARSIETTIGGWRQPPKT